ncbi:unnamed protein product [Arabis nemorensis]|uniref:X8 domain-containing protein n=1 Tax=Arabis nemorensis TaxID=586526 RepID=A0A565BLA3_9BRAS|nr:unnamed protein product [Arabis nemorensis]
MDVSFASSSSSTSPRNFIKVNAEMKTWCVAKPSSDQATLLENINYACSHVDSRVLSSGCPCFSPGNLINHASIAMNLYYQANGRNFWNCNFKNSGLIARLRKLLRCIHMSKKTEEHV